MTQPPTRPRALFISYNASYNALIEPFGPTQILPYVCGLADTYEMVVLSFGDADERHPAGAPELRRTERARDGAGVDRHSQLVAHRGDVVLPHLVRREMTAHLLPPPATPGRRDGPRAKKKAPGKRRLF
jgi:hypothetical protein